MPNPDDLLMGRYRLFERIGSGGMATVHRAHDERLDRDVAVKILLPNLADDPATAARFEREARSLAASTHPGVVAVFDVDAGDPATGLEPFFVMELCRGGSLADRLAGPRRMAPDDLVPILVQIADGLADLHRRGVVHRDVKPQNILFGDDRPKLADFGLALSSDGEALSELTTPGTAVGTLAYLAPEILAGQRATTAADVYGLGVVAFVGLTGQPPRPAGSMAELVAASGLVAPPTSSVAPDLGRAFDASIGAALALRPADRPDALSFASGLASALGQWTRDGGPARFAAAQVGPATGAAADAALPAAGTTVPAAGATALAGAPPDDASLVGVAQSPAWDPAGIDTVTTELPIPPGGTAAFAVDAHDVDRPPEAPAGEARPASRRGSTLVTAAVAVVAAIALFLIVDTVLRLGPAGVAGPSSAPPASGRPASVAPSIGPSPSAIRPSPSVDPAVAALDAMDAAISAARGGPDGLKGKEANDLEQRVADIRQLLARGDRGGALDGARKLDRKVADVAKDLGKTQADRLRTASADLVRALGG